MNIYQNQESYYEEGTQKQRLGQWNVSNTVEITLRDMTQASELTELLSKSGANNVWGPNYFLEDTASVEEKLMEMAVNNARQKAERLAAAAAGTKLGRVISVTEGSSGGSGVMPFARMEAGGGGGAPMQPGSTLVTKTVTVTFELR